MAAPRSGMTVSIDTTSPQGKRWLIAQNAFAQGQAFVASLPGDPYGAIQDGITESYAASYSSLSVVGRAEPLQVYVGGTTREINYVFQMRPEGAGEYNDVVIAEVINPALWLDALQYPVNGNKSETNPLWIPPPPLLIEIPGILKMRCVMSGCSINWMAPFTDIDGTLYPNGADVQCRFMSVASALSNNFKHSSRSRIQNLKA